MFEYLPTEVHKNSQNQSDLKLERFQIDKHDDNCNTDGCDKVR